MAGVFLRADHAGGGPVTGPEMRRVELQPPTLAQQARALGGGVADLARRVASRDPAVSVPEAFWSLSEAVERLAYLTANAADLAQIALLAANRGRGSTAASGLGWPDTPRSSSSASASRESRVRT